MSNSRKIAGNSAAQIIGRLIGTVFALLTFSILARHLGTDGYGRFTTAISFLQFFGVLVDFGLAMSMARMLGTRPADDGSRIASNITTMRVMSGLVFFALAPIVALAFPYGDDLRLAITIGAFSFFAMSVSAVLTGIFQRHLATKLIALAEVAGRLFLLLGVWWAASRGMGLPSVMIILALSNVIQLVLSLIFAGRFVSLRPEFDFSLWRDIARESWPIAVGVALNLIYLKGDVIVLSLFRSETEVGLYGAAYKILDVVTVVPTVFMGLVLPLLAADWVARDMDGLRDKLRKSFDVMSAMALPLFFGTLAVAPALMALIGGEEYRVAGPYLVLLMLAACAVFLGGVFTYAVVAIDLQKKMLWAFGLDAVVSIALYFWLIPDNGAAAAAWVTVFSEVFISAAAMIAVLCVTKAKLKLRTFGRALIASLLMYLTIRLAPNAHVLIQVAIGLVTYPVALLAVGGVSRQSVMTFISHR